LDNAFRTAFRCSFSQAKNVNEPGAYIHRSCRRPGDAYAKPVRMVIDELVEFSFAAPMLLLPPVGDIACNEHVESSVLLDVSSASDTSLYEFGLDPPLGVQVL
jgi:hypothetical protein